jgi:acetyl-CoA carboxylase carboxyl transferase subunit alpha
MGLTAPRLHELGLVDEVVDEPLGGAHRDPAGAAARLRRALVSSLDELSTKPLDDLIASRMQRLRGYGNFSS